MSDTKKLILDLTKLKDRDELLKWIGKSFGFPEHYGNHWNQVKLYLSYIPNQDQIEITTIGEANEKIERELVSFHDVIDDYNQKFDGNIRFRENNQLPE